MKRANVYLSAVAGFGGMLLLISAAQAQPGAQPPPAGGQPTPPASRPTIAVFNMAAVMKEYGKAKYKVYELNEERKKMSSDLVVLQGQYLKNQQDLKIQVDPASKDQLQKKQVELTRMIEDKDREINKHLNDKATAIISSLYDEIKTVVDKTAEMNGYHIVFAYPDASTPEDLKSAYVKELKLKPPAAQPFYVARHVDITGVVIQTLNTWYPSPPVPPEAKQLPPPPGPTAGPPGPGGLGVPGGPGGPPR
ncbi:MAG TPA: OmpH family outer membrane protein [Gemmata sp.]|nr:OmpH family outer membrane protein [Gemmata sp.]